MPNVDLKTGSERLREVLEAPRRAFLPLPDTQVIERPGWLQLITPSLRQGGLNEVAYSALDEMEADAVIDETLEVYRRYRGAPAGTAGLVTFERSVYLLGGSCSPPSVDEGCTRPSSPRGSATLPSGGFPSPPATPARVPPPRSWSASASRRSAGFRSSPTTDVTCSRLEQERTWMTREDPFEEEWASLPERLKQSPIDCWRATLPVLYCFTHGFPCAVASQGITSCRCSSSRWSPHA